MTNDAREDEPAILQAAALTFAMLRFELESAHESHHNDPEEGRLGVDKFVFLPSWRTTPREQVVPYLASLTSPALIYATPRRGVASLILVDELTGERKAWGQKTLDNHMSGINEQAAQMNLQADSTILLEVSDEQIVISLDVLRLWSQRFGAPVGWNFGPPSPGDERASAQIRLFASDGRVSPPQFARAPWERPGW